MKRILALALTLSCSNLETSSVQQAVSWCPYPPMRCLATNVLSDGYCNRACIDQGGVAAYCPELTAGEGVACANLCDPLYPMYGDAWFECMTDCGNRVWHQCVGGYRL